MTESNATWLPNLVGGVSIWKLAVDLNEPKFMDGRLLVPETEGSESLPVTVRWDLSGLVPLAEAKATDPAGTSAAIADFQACLERTAKVFSTPNSGYDKYKEAFTVPSIDAEGGNNYFYSAAQKKVFVANWGASPRSMGGKAEYVFGWQDWGKVFAGGALAAGAGAAVAGAAAAAAPAPVEATPDEKKDDKKKDDKTEEKKRPWWLWPLFALVALAAVLLALALLKSCEEQKDATGTGDAAADAAKVLDAATDAAATADASSALDASVDAAGGALADAGDAGADAGALADAGKDAGGRDGGKDGGLAMDDEDDDDEPGGTITGSSGGGGGGGPVVVTVGPAGGPSGAKSGPHRRHYQAEATAWRVTTGKERIARTEQRGHRFDVWLGAGRTFDGVRVEWQDASGKWHVH